MPNAESAVKLAIGLESSLPPAKELNRSDLFEALRSENQRLRQQNLRLAEKLGSLTKVFSRVTHGIRNDLLGIKGRAENTLISEKVSDRIAAGLIRIIMCANRADAAVTYAMEKSRLHQEPKPEAIDVANFLQSVVKDNKSLLGPAEVQIFFNPPKEPVSIFIDPGIFRSVIDNLLLNAYHAMEGRKTKRITIKTDKVDEENFIIYMEDTGHGMTLEVQTNCFQRDFSTKKGIDKQSSGMGLYMALQVMKEAGGDLWLVKSEVGVGTTFALCLPIYRNNP